MATTRLLLADILDLNVGLDGQPADAGVTYELADGLEQYARVTPWGVVVPKAPGTVLVYAKNEEGAIARRYIVVIRENPAEPNGPGQVGLDQILGANDHTPPIVANLDVDYDDALDLLTVSQYVFDNESPNLQVRIDIRRSDNSVVIVDDALVTSPGTHQYPMATPGQYIVTLRATNVAGLSSVETTDVMVGGADATPPQVNSLSYRYVSGTIRLVFDIADAESGIANYIVDIREKGNASNVIADSLSVGLDNQMDFGHAPDGKTYRLTLTATNGDGLKTVIVSDLKLPEAP